MKAFTFLILTLAIPLLGVQTAEDIRVLIITGGHSFEEEPFFKMFDNIAGITYEEIKHPKANQIYKVASEKYDVIVFYDMVQEISEDQKDELLSLTKSGTGLVLLHHALVSYNNWDEFMKLSGGRYHQKPSSKNGQIIPASTYRHDVEIPVKIETRHHPVTKGLKHFTIFDEVYGGFTVLPEVTPLLSTTHPESSKYIGWAHRYQNSRIVYLQPGHDHHAYEDPNYRKLLKNAIFWVAAGKQ